MAASGKRASTDWMNKLNSAHISSKQKNAYNKARKSIEDILKKEAISPKGLAEARTILDELTKILSSQDEKDCSIISAKEAILKIRKKLDIIPNVERGLLPGVTGQGLRPTETRSFNPETSWLVTAISFFIKWLKEGIEIDENHIKMKCPDTLKEVQTDLLYIRQELTRRFGIIRQKEHEKTECLKSLLEFIKNPSLAHGKIPHKGVFTNDPDERMMEDIKQIVRELLERSPKNRNQMLDSEQRLKKIRDYILKFGPVSQAGYNQSPDEDVILEIENAVNEKHAQLLKIESRLKVMCGNDGSVKKRPKDESSTPIERIQQIINDSDRSKIDVKNESPNRESYPKVIEKLEQCVESMAFDPKWFGKLKNDKDNTIQTLGRIAERNSKWAVNLKQMDKLEEDIRNGNIFVKTKNGQKYTENETGVLFIRQRIKSTHVEMSEVSEEVTAIESILTAANIEKSDVEVDPPRQLTQASNNPKDTLKSQLKSMVKRLERIMDGQLGKIERYEREIATLQQVVAEMKEGILNLEKSTEKLDGEKRDLLLRLSAVAGAKLVQDNPNIADLSDQNRPTKIAEKFREIYDSQWTDAYEALYTDKKTNEREICQQLVEILFNAEKTSRAVAETQFTSICQSCFNPTENRAGDVTSPKEYKNLECAYRNLIHDLRKQTGHISVQAVLQESVGREMSSLHPIVLKYKQKCVEICWYMNLQTPPVVLEQIPKEKRKFNRDRYTEYTKKGTQIDFVAWPPMLLHKDGPRLCKGVAQGK